MKICNENVKRSLTRTRPNFRFSHEHLSSKLQIKMHKIYPRTARIPSKETKFSETNTTPNGTFLERIFKQKLKKVTLSNQIALFEQDAKP